jgi:hypothetical protein
MWWVLAGFLFWTLLALVGALVVVKAIHRDRADEEEDWNA